MKSKMKSTFAIIAVALMIMVAVVPMIGVFTSDSEATITVDPDSEKDNKITLTVMMYDSAATPAATTGNVKITYGSYLQTGTITTATSGVVFYIYEETVASVEVAAVDSDGNEIETYSKVTLSDLEAKKTYTASLVQGKASKDVTFQFKTAPTTVTKIADVLTEGQTITGSYTVYTRAGTAPDYTYTQVDNGTFDVNAGVGKFYYPKGLTGNVYLDVSMQVTSLSLTFAAKQEVALGSTNQVIKSEESVITIDPQTVMKKVVTVSNFTDGTTSFTPIQNELRAADTTIPVTLKKAMFYGIIGETPAWKMTLQSDDSEKEFTATVSSNNVGTSGYTLTEVAAGSVVSSVGSYRQAGILSAVWTPTSAESSPTNASITVDANGVFFKFFKDLPAGALGSQKFTLSDGTEFAVTDFASLSSTSLAVKATTTGYSEVSGMLKLATDAAPYISGKELVINGAKTFGPLVTKTVTSGNNFAFLAETGKTIIISVDGADLSGKTSVVPGSSNSGSTGITISMSTQTGTLYLKDALGAKLAGFTAHLVDADNAAVADFTNVSTNKYTVTVRADIDLSSYKVWFVEANNYKFAANAADKSVAFTEGGSYASTSAKYTIQVFTFAGVPIYNATPSNVISVYTASAYKTTAGTVIYDKAATATTLTPVAYPTTAENNAYTFVADYEMMKKTSESVTSTATDVVMAIPAAGICADNLFAETYVLTADEDGYVYIWASVDSLEGKLTRIDGTAIAGATVQVFNGDNAQGAIAYTSADGEFTVYSNSKIVDGYKLSLSKAGYPVEKVNIFKNKVKQTEFTFTKDLYEFSYIDADDEKIANTVYDNVKISYNGSTPANAATQYAWEEGGIVEIVMQKNNKDVRSFLPHILTEDDVATGEITFVSNQAKYTFTSTDADGTALGAVSIKLYRYYNGQPVVSDIPALETVYSAVTGKATVSIKLPYVAADGTVDSVLTEYGYVATKGNDETAADYYAFDTEATAIESTKVAVKSIYAPITFFIVDAAGMPLVTSPDAGAVYKDGKEAKSPVVVGEYKVTFINDPEADYTVSITAKGGYTYEKKQAPVLGILCANEQWVVGDVVDATGMSIGKAGLTKITAYEGLIAGNQATYAEDGNYYKILVDVDAVTEYRITDEAPAHYTFETTDSPIIAANEQTVKFNAVTANGYDVDATFTNPKAFDAAGKMIGNATDDGFVVDVEEAEYYQATVAATGTLAGVLHFSGISTDGEFVANESYITGSVPYSGKGTQKATIELYLGDNLVKELPADVVNKTEYVAYVDLSGYIADTAGVVFDSILAVYYENNVEVGYAAVDPYTAVNNVVSPTVQVYVAVLDAPSALIARHVSIAQVGNTATVSADGQFIVADDDAIYTDGQYIYTFAGWYVDNEKVSSAPSFTFSLTENVVIVPEYTVKYEKISDANAQVDPEIIIEEITKENTGIDTNVLIIGICAVIVALIAVVYAVIKKE